MNSEIGRDFIPDEFFNIFIQPILTIDPTQPDHHKKFRYLHDG